jgi:hypothetical protein
VARPPSRWSPPSPRAAGGLRRDRRHRVQQVAGPGTRKNIDEFTRTTAGAVEKVGGAKKGKAIIIINPAEPR